MTAKVSMGELNPLSLNGPLVSKSTLGSMTFGVETNKEEAFKQLDYFIEHGGSSIDTADAYADGVSEQIIGEWLSSRKISEEIILATKGRFAPPEGSNGASRRSLTLSVNKSLKRLQVEAIDVYYVHGWDKNTEVIETLSVLADLVKAGKIHHIAFSNLSAWQLERIVMTAKANGFPVPVTLQQQYNTLERGIELEVLPCALEAGIPITAWSPLAGGWLTGKYSAQTFPSGNTRLGEDPNRGVEAYHLRNKQTTYEVLDVMAQIAKEHDRPLTHVALAWLLSRPGVATAIVGARTIAQLKENLAAADLTLAEEDLNRLTQVSNIDLPQYPYRFLESWSKLNCWARLGY